MKYLRAIRIIKAGVGILALSATAFANVLPAPVVNEPASNYTFPVGFSPFAPPLTNSGAYGAAPAVGEWTRVNAPGDTMVVTGSRFSSFSGTAEGRDTRFIFFGQSAVKSLLSDGQIQRLDGMQAAVTLPTALPADEMYMLWIENRNGYSMPVGINQTEVWWVGPEKVSKGDSVSLYGRNLQLGSGSAYLYIEELNLWLTSVSANPYKADFALPANMANGTYTLWAHNGSGREYGWAAPVKLTVASKTDWSKGKTINVRNAPYNAAGNNVNNDARAIQSAIDAASAGDTVYLPAGTYRIGSSIRNLTGKRLLGDGMGLTTITTHSSFANSSNNEMFFVDRSSNFEIRGLTASAGSYPKGKVFRGRDMLDGTFADVRFTQVGSSVSADLVDISNSQRIRFSSCEFYPRRNVFVGATRQVRFEQCDWYGIYDCNVLLSVWGSDELSITGCSAQHYDDSDPTDGSGWCQGRFVWGSGHGGVHRNLYFGGNRVNNMHPRFDPRFSKYEQNGRMNTGEHVMFEWTATYYEGSPSAVQGNRVRLANPTEGLAGCIAVVIDGPGLGQSRLVSSYDVATGWMDTDEPWRIVPGTGSTLAIGRYVNRMAVYGNYFDGDKRLMDPLNEGPAAINRTATTAVSVYGAFQDLVVSDNTIQQARYGIISWGFGYDYIQPNTMNNLQPNYFNLFQKNSIDSCYEGIANTVNTFNSFTNSPGKIIAYNVWRGNRISNVSKAAVGYNDKYAEFPIGMCVYDSNTASNFGLSVDDSANLENQVWVDNQFTGSGSGSGISFSPGHVPSLSRNTWNNFSAPYSGGPGAVLELPTRVVKLNPSQLNGSVPVCNGGTTALSWTASSGAGWLSLQTTAGTVANENQPGLIAFTVDLAKVPAGNPQAIVTVRTAGGDSKQITVVYERNPSLPHQAVLEHIRVSGVKEVTENSWSKYSCMAYYSDGSTQQVEAVWSVNRPFTITSQGWFFATDLGRGSTAVIRAEFEGVSTEFRVTTVYVPPVLSDIIIVGKGTIDELSWELYECYALFSDNTYEKIVPDWSVTSPFVIYPFGLLEGRDVATNTAITVSASYKGFSDSLPVTVKDVPAIPVSISIAGPNELAEGDSTNFICMATYSDGSQAQVSPVWSASHSFTIDSAGLLSAGLVAADLTVTINASFEGLSAARQVLIRDLSPRLTGIEVVGAASIEEESWELYRCVAHYSDGSSAEVQPAWSVDNAAFQVFDFGLLDAGLVDADTNITISAVFEGMQASLGVTVRNLDQIVYPLSGFQGKWLDCYIWDETSGEYTTIGVEFEPVELVLQGLDPTHRYWLGIRQYDEITQQWPLIHGCWIDQLNLVFTE